MFDNDDEFGIQSFREDVSYVMQANQIVVKLVRFNRNKSKVLQSDYLGIRSKTFDDVPELIRINLGSQSPSSQDDTQHGYDGSGNRVFTAFIPFNIEICNKDIIEFVKDYNYDIKSGARFRIKLNDAGMYQGQFTFKEFELTMIDANNEPQTKRDDYNENK